MPEAVTVVARAAYVPGLRTRQVDARRSHRHIRMRLAGALDEYLVQRHLVPVAASHRVVFHIDRVLDTTATED